MTAVMMMLEAARTAASAGVVSIERLGLVSRWLVSKAT